MTKLRGSRTASIQDARKTEITKWLLVIKSANKKEPEIIELQEYARSGEGKTYVVPLPGIKK